MRNFILPLGIAALLASPAIAQQPTAPPTHTAGDILAVKMGQMEIQLATLQAENERLNVQVDMLQKQLEAAKTTSSPPK